MQLGACIVLKRNLVEPCCDTNLPSCALCTQDQSQALPLAFYQTSTPTQHHLFSLLNRFIRALFPFNGQEGRGERQENVVEEESE